MKSPRWMCQKTLLGVHIALLFLTQAGAAFSQTKLTTGLAYCGATAVPNCQAISFTTGGTMWVHYDSKSNRHFIQFSDVEPSEFTAITSSMNASFTAIDPVFIIPGEPSSFDPDNRYLLTIRSFSGRDSDGDVFYGSGRLYFHYIKTSGSGRGGGGAGLKLIQEAGGQIELIVK